MTSSCLEISLGFDVTQSDRPIVRSTVTFQKYSQLLILNDEMFF